MRIKDCTKEELIFLLKKLTDDSFSAKFKLVSYLSEIEIKRSNKYIREADHWADRAEDFRKQYAEVLKPYRYCKVVDIPIHIIKEAERCLKEAEQCDRLWQECMQNFEEKMYD